MNNSKLIPVILLASVIGESALANTLSDQMFQVFDKNKNGELTMQEFRNGGMDAEGMNWSEGLSEVCTEHTLKAAEKDLITTFKLLDANNDKKISKAEFSSNGDRVYDEYWKASFRQADTNGDNYLSNGEFRQQANSYIKKLETAYQMNKIPGECKADVEYWTEYYKGMEQYVDTAYQYLDQNSDNRMTYDEYLGSHLWQ